MNKRKVQKIVLSILCIVLIICFIKSFFYSKGHNKNIILKSQLFKGPYKKIEPHLDLISGCVYVRYKDKNKTLVANYEIWEDGSVINKGNLIETSMDKSIDGELSVSLKEIYDQQEKSEFKIVTSYYQDESNVSSTEYVPKFESGLYYEIKELKNDKLIKLGEENSIWMIYAYEGENFKSSPTLNENAKKANWALKINLLIK